MEISDRAPTQSVETKDREGQSSLGPVQQRRAEFVTADLADWTLDP